MMNTKKVVKDTDLRCGRIDLEIERRFPICGVHPLIDRHWQTKALPKFACKYAPGKGELEQKRQRFAPTMRVMQSVALEFGDNKAGVGALVIQVFATFGVKR